MAALWHVFKNAGKPPEEPPTATLPTKEAGLPKEPVRPTLNTAEIFGFGDEHAVAKARASALTAEQMQLVRDAPKLAKQAMYRGGVIALVGTGVLTTATLAYLDIRSMEELGNDVGRQKIGLYLKPIADCAEVLVRRQEGTLAEWAVLASPAVKQVEGWANAKKEDAGGDVARLLGVGNTVAWLRESAERTRSKALGQAERTRAKFQFIASSPKSDETDGNQAA